MTNKAIKIEMPTTVIEFDLGVKKYKLSLADKSRARINKKYQDITDYETKKNKALDLIISNRRDELEDLDAEQTKREETDNPMRNSEKEARRSEIDDKYQAEIDSTQKKLDTHTKKESTSFLDYLFGDGAGKEIFEMCDENTIAVTKVIFQVMTEFNRENDIYDYRTKYLAKLATTKADD